MQATSGAVVVPCRSCGRPNRIPPSNLAETGRCGACSAALPPLAEPLEVDEATFDAVVSGARVPVLVDFWAPWCGPCRAAAPHVARVAQDSAGRAIVLKVDTDQEQDLARRFGVQSIPYFVVLSRGQVVHQQAGLVDARTMASWFASAR